MKTKIVAMLFTLATVAQVTAYYDNNGNWHHHEDESIFGRHRNRVEQRRYNREAGYRNPGVVGAASDTAHGVGNVASNVAHDTGNVARNVVHDIF